MSAAETPNPFTSARRIAGVKVLLSPDDVSRFWPELDTERAEQLLNDHGAAIAGHMHAAGLVAALELFRRKGGK